MPDPIAGSGVDSAIDFALNGLSTRQRVISNNLANIDTPGFKSATVSFEDQLRRAIGPDGVGQMRLAASHPQHLGASQPGLEAAGADVVRDSDAAVRSDGNSVDVEREMVELADTAISYSVLVQVASARLSLARYVVNEGRR